MLTLISLQAPKMISLIIVLSFLTSQYETTCSNINEATFPKGHLQPLGNHREPENNLIDELLQVPSAEEFWKKYVKPSKAVVLRGAAKHSPAFTKWTDEYVKKNFGDLEVRLERKREKSGQIPVGVKGIGRDTIGYYHQVTSYGTMNVAVALLFSRFDNVKSIDFSGCHDNLTYTPLSELDMDWKFSGQGNLSMGNPDLEDVRALIKESLNDKNLHDGIINMFRELYPEKSHEWLSKKAQNIMKAVGLSGKKVITSKDIDKLGRNELRKIALAVEPTDMSNTDMHEYTYVFPSVIRDIVNRLQEPDGRMDKQKFIEQYKQETLGTAKFAKELISKLTKDTDRSWVSQEEVSANLETAILPYQVHQREEHIPPGQTEPQSNDAYTTADDNDDNDDNESLEKDSTHDRIELYTLIPNHIPLHIAIPKRLSRITSRSISQSRNTLIPNHIPLHIAIPKHAYPESHPAPYRNPETRLSRFTSRSISQSRNTLIPNHIPLHIAIPKHAHIPLHIAIPKHACPESHPAPYRNPETAYPESHPAPYRNPETRLSRITSRSISQSRNTLIPNHIPLHIAIPKHAYPESHPAPYRNPETRLSRFTSRSISQSRNTLIPNHIPLHIAIPKHAYPESHPAPYRNPETRLSRFTSRSISQSRNTLIPNHIPLHIAIPKHAYPDSHPAPYRNPETRLSRITSRSISQSRNTLIPIHIPLHIAIPKHAYPESHPAPYRNPETRLSRFTSRSISQSRNTLIPNHIPLHIAIPKHANPDSHPAPYRNPETRLSRITSRSISQSRNTLIPNHSFEILN
ncbi:hypothetical protein QZH41_011006 [Actinostola sp. cb2023]|nr:hypothetical protein QZH41_011006 [Actinostola sp. cb2023]